MRYGEIKYDNCVRTPYAANVENVDINKIEMRRKMHTYNYKEDKTKDKKGKDIYFHYNGDFSGDVIINSDNKELEIPAKAILEFVAYWIMMGL